MSKTTQVSDWNIDATDWILISTPGSKYAHAPNWSVFGSMPQNAPACGTPMPAWDPYNLEGMKGSDAEGKPSCPKCIRMLRHHLSWLSAWVGSYENLTGEADDAE